MATSSRRRREGFPATAPKFFKIILHPQSDTLRIPNEFTQTHGPDLRKRVFLKVPEGSAMEVELIQSSTSNGQALFKKGWLEFKERYSIGFGYLLVFTYNGNSQFDVLIFDPSASEITYPLEETQSESDDDDDSVVVLENPQVCRNPLAKKQRKCRNNNTIEFPPSQKNTSVNSLDESSTSGCRNRNSIRDLKESKGVARETSVAYQKALDYKCGANMSNTCHKQPFFISLMQQSYVSPKFVLNVPVPFVKAAGFRSSGTTSLHLMMNGRKWLVNCILETGCRKAILAGGWRKFVKDNGLKVGDACIFEAHKSHNKLVWNVMVFPS